MSIWVKICGNTSLTDARIAVDAGADAVGFVFAASPRQVTVEQVAAICAGLPAQIEKIGVFVDARLEEICAAVKACGLTGVQLHFEAEIDWPARLRARLGAALRILRVVHFEAGAAEGTARQVAMLAEASGVDGVLVDSRTAMAVGGTGMAFDWELARGTVFVNSGAAKLIAAGGLTPENVAEAVWVLRPWGVDVVSGVEAAPGCKDAEKVRACVGKARAAGGVG
jgi:phosphoribosylanthranilate isomerase